MPEGLGTPTPEIPRPTPEIGPAGPERSAERPAPSVDVRVEAQPVDIYADVIPVAPIATPHTEATALQPAIENILSEGLGDIYKQLDEATKQRVKVSGEQAAVSITALLSETKVQAKKILDIIIGWLQNIPGLNRHFLEQEAKIKADKVLTLKQT